MGFGKGYSQSDIKHNLSAFVQNAANDKVLEGVHVINLNTVKGTVTDASGNFELEVHVDDILYFSHLGFEPLKTRVSNDWINLGNVVVQLTEVGIALEEVLILANGLTGFLDIDYKNIPINLNYKYQITGLTTGYEGSDKTSRLSRVVKTIASPINRLQSIFSKSDHQLKKLRKIKEDDQIIDLLRSKFSRETLSTLLNISEVDINTILRNCKYSKSFIKTANDLQILNAISECYEEYSVLSK